MVPSMKPSFVFALKVIFTALLQGRKLFSVNGIEAKTILG